MPIFETKKLNTFQTLLRELKVKSTKFSNEIYQNHP